MGLTAADIERHADPADPEFSKNLIENVHRLWFGPEVERRRAAGSLPAGFKLYRARVLLPRGKPLRVELNDEIGWEASVKRGRTKPFEKGETIYMHEVRAVESVAHPELDGERVPFFFLYHRGGGVYSAAFDFAPEATDTSANWGLGRVIAAHLNECLRERIIRDVEDAGMTLLRESGLLMAPAIMPYPFSAIVVALKDGQRDVAERLLREECVQSFWNDRTPTWMRLPAVERRRGPIEEALACHFKGQFHASVYTLYPTIVGLMGDYIVARDPSLSGLRKDAEKAQRFADLVTERLPQGYAWRRILSDALNFLTTGPFFEQFWDWNASVNPHFPSRHVIAHGKYEPTLFTEANSLRVILLLDAIITVLDAAEPLDLPGTAQGVLPTL